jgi:hypothetical protein
LSCRSEMAYDESTNVIGIVDTPEEVRRRRESFLTPAALAAAEALVDAEIEEEEAETAAQEAQEALRRQSWLTPAALAAAEAAVEMEMADEKVDALAEKRRRDSYLTPAALAAAEATVDMEIAEEEKALLQKPGPASAPPMPVPAHEQQLAQSTSSDDDEGEEVEMPQEFVRPKLSASEPRAPPASTQPVAAIKPPPRSPRLSSVMPPLPTDPDAPDSPARRVSVPGEALSGVGVASRGDANGGASARGGPSVGDDDDVEYDMVDIDNHMLARTLDQVSRRQRTLASLRVQLSQAEHMRGQEEAKAAQASRAPKRKWHRVAASLHIAVAMLSPMPNSVRPHRSSNPAVATCAVDGWLHRLAADGETWRRGWYALKWDGLLRFASEVDSVPRGILLVDVASKVESTDDERTFRLHLAPGETFTFVCEEGSKLNSWLHAFRTVIADRVAASWVK